MECASQANARDLVSFPCCACTYMQNEHIKRKYGGKAHKLWGKMRPAISLCPRVDSRASRAGLFGNRGSRQPGFYGLEWERGNASAGKCVAWMWIAALRVMKSFGGDRVSQNMGLAAGDLEKTRNWLFGMRFRF